MRKLFSTLMLCVSFCAFISAQVTVSGQIKDNQSGEPLFGTAVVIKGTTEGATTDFDGNFSFQTNQQFPLTLSISFVGYNTKEVTYTSEGQKLKINLETTQINLKEVKITDTRLSDKLKESAQTIESMDFVAIKETPSADFYEGLGHLKGVDVTSASIGFKVINTRGFNSTSPVRSLQLIDGVDNQSPGLNFSLGNFLGASELDVQKVDLVVGANGALYGPNAFNGVINMKTKDPFLFPGLSVMAKVGERNLRETALRYAHVFTNKDSVEKLAIKANFYYMEAYDWEATNLDSVFGSEYGPSNPGRYDAVNRYGDENLSAFANNETDIAGRIANPGLNRWFRSGYEEKDIVDYNTNNLKANLALHYKINPKTQFIASSNYGKGTTVYQGDNRFSLKNIQFFQHRLEVNQKDKYFVRAYVTHEDAGDSYDAVFTSLLLQDVAKEDARWSQDYINYWSSNITPKIEAMPGFPDWSFGQGPYPIDQQDAFIASISDSLFVYHQQALEHANTANPLFPSQDFLQPGTASFDSAFQSITSKKSFTQGGSGFFDKSALGHFQAQYKFEPQKDSVKLFDLIVGASFREYRPNSNGTIFKETPIYDSTQIDSGVYQIDTSFTRIKNREFGVYTGIEKNFLQDENLKVSATVRMDKNQNFDYLFSPAASLVYVHQDNHTYRLSFSSAIRNPTLTDQYLFYNVGRAILLGNIDGVDSLITTESMLNFFDNLDKDSLDYFNVAPIRPEKVKTIEIGYRGSLGSSVYIDGSYYFSSYKDFIGYEVGVDAVFNNAGTNIPSSIQAYRVASNAKSTVTTQGFSIGINYYFKDNYTLLSNYSWNTLNKKGTDDPIIPAFNTPEHKFNIGVNGSDLKVGNVRNLGFAVNYKWVQGFLFEGSPQFTGFVPTYDAVDMQINYAPKKLKTTFKLGVSNLFGVRPLFDKEIGGFSDRLDRAFSNRNMQVYGGPFVGRMAYVSVLVELGKLSKN